MRNSSVKPSGDNSPALSLLERWQHDLAADRSPATVRRYVAAVRRFLAWYEQEERRELEIHNLTPIVLVGYRNALQRTEAPSTVNTHLSALRAWCRWLTQANCLTADPAARLKLVSRQAPLKPQSLEDTEVNALIRAAALSRHPLRDTALLQMLLQTGMRIGECAALAFEDIEFGEKRGQVTIRAGKGNKSRAVPLNGTARRALADFVAPLLAVEPTLKAVAAAWPEARSGTPPTPLWRSQKGGPMTASAIQRMLEGLVREGADRELVPTETSAHTLRHTFATHYLATHPGDLVGLATLLGHSSLNTTRIYVQPTADELAERVEDIDLNAYE